MCACVRIARARQRTIGLSMFQALFVLLLHSLFAFLLPSKLQTFWLDTKNIFYLKENIFHTIKTKNSNHHQLLFKFSWFLLYSSERIQRINRQREKYRSHYLPYALSASKHMLPLMNVYWEKRWAQKVDDLRKELNIETLDVKWDWL